ncbi:MAG: hypothetical protein ABEJ47_01990 [Halorhabdus sp.]
MTTITHPTIEAARTEIDAEREILVTEREAFQSLVRRVSEVTVETPQMTAGTGTAVVATTPIQAPSAGLQEIRTAYRETVMAVPHYESEYGESLRENLRVEVGASLAEQILDGDALTRPVHDAFLGAARRAMDERRRVQQYVDRERDSLRRFEAELTEIESAVVEIGTERTSASGTQALASLDDRLATLESRCADLAKERQQRVHDRPETDYDRIDGLGVFEYLYADLETTTPVLSAIASCLATIRHHRRRCLR